jgi:hypothetical protein
VLSYKIIVASSVTTQWKSATTALTGAMSQIVGVPNDGKPTPLGMDGRYCHFETAPGEALNLVLGSGVQASGHVEYETR